MAISVTIVGSNSAIPCHGRHPSAQIVHCDQEKILIDCGEGTQIRLSQLGIRKSRISTILISHLHGDHVYGLPGLLTTMNLLGREKPLEIIGPEGLSGFLNGIFSFTGVTIKFPLTIKEVNAADKVIIKETPELSIYAFPLDHRIQTNGYLISEKEKPRTLNGALADEMNIPYEWRARLKSGEDYIENDQVVIRSEDITEPPEAPRSFAYCSDTKYMPSLEEYISGVNLLYHEATFLHEMSEQATERYHSTALQAAEIASMAGVGKLIIGHLSSRYMDFTALVKEAKLRFKNTEAAEEGRIFEA